MRCVCAAVEWKYEPRLLDHYASPEQTYCCSQGADQGEYLDCSTARRVFGVDWHSQMAPCLFLGSPSPPPPSETICQTGDSTDLVNIIPCQACDVPSEAENLLILAIIVPSPIAIPRT